MPDPSVSPPAAALAPRLVGREGEEAALRAALAALLAGRGGLVLIAGAAGIGKTALSEALAREATARGALVLVGRCYDLTETPPYGPWLDALARAPARAGELLPRGAGSGPSASQGALAATIRSGLGAAAGGAPLLLLLEDLHWADPASLDLLRALSREAAGRPLLLVATYRDQEVDRHQPLYAALPALIREAQPARLDLRPLTADALRALVGARYTLAAGDLARLVTDLQARSEGNPFYMVELLRALEDEGTLRPATGAGTPAAPGTPWVLGDLGRSGLPPLLRQVLDARLDRLGEGDRSLLAVAATIGQEVPLALLGVVGMLDEEALLALVERGVAARVLTATDDGLAIHFAHALVREALYEGILPARRRVWHRRVAEALLAMPDPDPDAVAEHLRRAGDERAAEWLARAGGRAQRAWAYATAVQRFEAALALLLGRESWARERGWLHYRLGLLRLPADPEQALAALDDAARSASAVGDAALTAYARYHRGKARCQQLALRAGLADLQAGVSALEELPARGRVVLDALGGFPAAPTTFDEQNPRGALVTWLAIAGRFAEVRTIAEANVAAAGDSATGGGAARAAYGDAYLALAYALAAQGQPAAARDTYGRAREIYGAIGDQQQLAVAWYSELRQLVLPYETDRIEERRRLEAAAERAAARASERVDPRVAGRRRLPLLLLEGQWDELAELEPLVRADRRAEAYARLARERGDADRSRAFVRQFLPGGPATEPGDHIFLSALTLQRLAAALSLDTGDLPAARAWLAAHDRWLAWGGVTVGRAEGHLGWAAYHRAAGDPDRARDRAEQALAHASNPRQPLSLLAAHRLLGELATAAGDHPAAEGHLATALALAEACAAPYERALTLLALAGLRRATGDRAAVEPLLAAARDICTALGANRALALADAMSPQRATVPPGGFPAGLTVREVEVLRLIAAGQSNREIAEALSLSVRTVDRHTDNLYRKADARGRADAVAFAARHGLLAG